MANLVPEFMIGRIVVQTFGAGCGMAVRVGTAVVGDIYCLEERGTALGVFTAVCISLGRHIRRQCAVVNILN